MTNPNSLFNNRNTPSWKEFWEFLYQMNGLDCTLFSEDPFFNGGVTMKNKEENTMKVSYKGVTGELIRLERVDMSGCICTTAQPYKWEMDIWDNEKGCKVSFSGVSLKDVKFLGGEVTYG